MNISLSKQQVGSHTKQTTTMHRLQLFADSFRDHVHVKRASHISIKTTSCHAPIYSFWFHPVYSNFNNHKENDAAAVCMRRRYSLLTFTDLPNYCSELLTPYKCHLRYIHTINVVFTVSRSYCTSFMVSLMDKDFSRTIYVPFRELGQILKIRECPRDSGIIGAYDYGRRIHKRCCCVQGNHMYMYKEGGIQLY